MGSRFFLLAMIFAMLAPGAVDAAIYKWVDANGTVSYRDTPPVEDVDSAPVILPELNVVEMPETSSAAQSDDDPAAQSGLRGGARAEVELYTTVWCHYCRKAKAFLRQRGIAYREYDVEKDPGAAERKKRLGGGNGVPFAVINGKAIRGFSAAAYTAALK